MKLFSQIAFVYATTLIICVSSILDPFRQYLKYKTPRLYSPLAPLFKNYEYSSGSLHFIECRLCVGFWITVISCLYVKDFAHFFLVFAASYFAATQER